jgi:flagellar basal body-associated protein FliL
MKDKRTPEEIEQQKKSLRNIGLLMLSALIVAGLSCLTYWMVLK